MPKGAGHLDPDPPQLDHLQVHDHVDCFFQIKMLVFHVFPLL